MEGGCAGWPWPWLWQGGRAAASADLKVDCEDERRCRHRRGRGSGRGRKLTLKAGIFEVEWRTARVAVVVRENQGSEDSGGEHKEGNGDGGSVVDSSGREEGFFLKKDLVV